MPNRSRLLLTAVSVICICLSASAQQLAPGGAPSPDEVELRSLVVKYFDAYAKKDLGAIAALWSKDAPGVASRRDLLQRMFAIEDYRFSEPAISRIKVEGSHASARVVIERNATRLRGSSVSIAKSTVRSDLSFVKENSEWRFWSEAPAVVSLANALAAAKTDVEREVLLAGDQDLINRELMALLNNQSDRAFTQADYSRALSILLSQRLVAEKLGDRREISQAWMNTGIIYFAQNRYQQALEAYQKGLTIEEELGRRSGQARFLTSVGLAQSALGKPQQAIEYFERGLAIHEGLNEKSDVAQTLENIGNVHYDQGDYALASEFYRRSLKWLESATAYAGRLLKIAKTEYEQGNDEAAIGFYAEAAGRLESSGDKRSVGYALHNIANIYYSQGDYAQALTHYRSCLGSEKEAGTRQGVAGALQGKPLDAARAAALLTDSETALLDFVETDESVYLFAFTKTGGRARSRRPVSPLKIYVLGADRGALHASVARFQEAITNRRDDAQTQARELYDLMLKPAQEQIAGRKHLIIAPDAVSWNLPFQALRSEDGRYLIENYAVSYAPSPTALGAISTLRARPKPRRASPPSLLAIANPALSPSTEARIKSILTSGQTDPPPDTQNEVDELSKLYGKRRIVFLVGAGASEDRLKVEAGKYDLLHLSVRGVLNETAPLFSFAAFSSNVEAKEDGALEAREIFDLDLKSDLAVISASELAWPKAGAMRSMTGLTWAWFVAGCPATVVSRWRCDESSDLTLEFHRRVKASWRKESKAKAWQSAVGQSLSREERRHPYFWAGFSILGDAR